MAKDTLWDDVIQTATGFKDFASELGNKTEKEIKAAMHACNDAANKGYPLAHEMLKRSIDGKGAVTYKKSSKMAKAIVGCKEYKSFLKGCKRSGKTGRKSIFFSSNRDLARSLYQASIEGNVSLTGKSYTFKGRVTDVYDFRLDMMPKKKTVKGFALRYAGNVAYTAMKLKLMKSYKVAVEIDDAGKL